MNWDEVCKYKWRSPNSNKIYLFKIEDGIIFYKKEEEEWWTMFGDEAFIDVHLDFLRYGYETIGENFFLTPQEKVCKKIALMEQRWLNYQQRKQHAI